MRFLLLSLLALSASGCVSWQPIASSAALACDAADIHISQAESGQLLDRWQASCRGMVYLCSVPAGLDNYPALCELQPTQRATRVVPLSE